MTTFGIVIALLGLSFVAVLIEKGIFALWFWIRRNADVKELREKIVELQKQNEIQGQKLSKYKDHEAIQNDLEIHRQLVYRSKTTGETYCIACWDGTRKLIHVVKVNQGYYCGICNKHRFPSND